MSPRTRADIDGAVTLVRNLFETSPAAAAEFVTRRRVEADQVANRRNADLNLAAAMHLVTDAAEDELNKLRAGAR